LSAIGLRVQSKSQLIQKKGLRIGGREAWNFYHKCRRIFEQKLLPLQVFQLIKEEINLACGTPVVF
jgi:hypothetical protein